MPFSFSSFNTILSELGNLPGYLRNNIPTAVFYPFTLVILAIGVLAGYALGWENVAAFWDNVSAWSKVILTAIAVLSFFFSAYLISGFQSAVSRGFQGDWPERLQKLAAGWREKHKQEQEKVYNAKYRMETLYSDIKEFIKQLEPPEPKMPLTYVVKMTRRIPPYHILSRQDLEEVATADATTCFVAQRSEVLDLPYMNLVALAKGDTIAWNQLARLPHAVWLNGMNLVSLALSTEAMPARLAPGDVVEIYENTTKHSQLLNPGGTLVVAVDSITQTETHGAQRQVVRLTLAVPPECVDSFMRHTMNNALSMVWRQSFDMPPLVNASLYTRRWLPIQDQPKYKPGDLLDISYTNPPIEFKQAYFVEATAGGWVLAIKADEAVKLAQIRFPDELMRQVPKTNYHKFKVPAFGEAIEKNSWNFHEQANRTIRGVIIEGKFVREEQEQPLCLVLRLLEVIKEGEFVREKPDPQLLVDIITDRRDLEGRFTCEEIKANEPILREKLNAPDSDEVIIDFPNNKKISPEDVKSKSIKKVHVVRKWQEEFGERRAVAFNCAVLTDGQDNIPKGLRVPRALGFNSENSTNEIDELLAGNVPEDWKIWKNAQLKPCEQANSPQDVDVGSAIGLLFTQKSVQDSNVPDVFPRTVLLYQKNGNSFQFMFPANDSVNNLLDDGQFCWEHVDLTRDLEKLLEEHLTTVDQLLKKFCEDSSWDDNDWQKWRQTMQKSLLHINMLDPKGKRPQMQRRFREKLNPRLQVIEDLLDRARSHFRLYYPNYKEDVAYTTIGNVLRAVDSYCDELYGLEASLVLSRMEMVMDKDRRDSLSSAREKLDLLQWSCLGAIVFSLTGVIIGILSGKPNLALIALISGPPIALLALQAAKGAALGYAEVLRLSFDSDRGKVLPLIGLKPPDGMTQKKEKELWTKVQRWWEYGSNAPEGYSLKAGSGNAKSQEPEA